MPILLSRLARTARTRWRALFLLTGGLLTVAGLALPSGVVLLPGLLILVFALLAQTQAPDYPTAAHLAAWPLHG